MYSYTSGQGLDSTKDVIQWRLKLSVKADGADAGTRYMKLHSVAANTFPIDSIQCQIPQADQATNTVYGNWHYPGAGVHMDDLIDDELRLTPLDTGSGTGTQECWITAYAIEAKLNEDTGIDQEIEAESIGAGLGFELEVYGDVQGTVAPASDITAAATVYDFDDDTSWNVTTGLTRTTDTGIKSEGTGSQKLVVAETVKVQCESADSTDKTAWTSSNASLDDEASIKTEGSASIKGTSTSTLLAQIAIDGFTQVDLTTGQKYFALFDIRVHRNGASEDGGIWLTLGIDSSNSSRWDFPLSDFADDTWQTVVIDYEAEANATYGTPVWSQWDHISVTFNTGTTRVSGFLVYIDNIRIIPKTAYAQKNDVASIDMSSSIDVWQASLRLDADALVVFESVQIYFDNTAGSGTTPPSPLSYMQIDDEDFGAVDTFEQTYSALSAAGDENAVQTIGILVTLHGKGVYAQSSGITPTGYVDDLQAASDASEYDAAAGAMIEKPADVFRHWCNAVGGVTVDETSFAAALTNLGSDKLAVDMRQLTPGGWRAGAAGLGYHSRANLVPKETSSGTVYALYTAESDYDWTVYDRVLTVWQTFGEAGPMGSELYTRFVAYYGFDAALNAESENAFGSVIRGDEDDNDLTVPSTADFQAAADKYGTSEAKVFFFPGIEDDATAKDVLGYYAHESIRAPRVFLFEGCVWWEIYDLEEDDLIQFTHPWSGATVKARVLGYTKRFGSEVNALRCLEVE
jgi:hypothetical protein